MSHLTKVKNVFTRKDLLLEVLADMGVTVTEPGSVRFYGGRQEIADIVAVLGSYDLGFRLERQLPTTAMIDADESTCDVDVATTAYVPVCDFYNGEVEGRFGRNLCQLNARYYQKLLQQSQDLAVAVPTFEDTKDYVLVTLEI